MAESKRLDHVLSWVLEHPWAITRPMLSVIATVLGRHVAGLETDTFTTRAPAAPSMGSGVAVIPMHGIISPRANLMSDISGAATFEDATRALAESVANPDVGSIVLDWDSPGGSVAGATEFAAKVLEARKVKRIISHANFEMASAAYWTGACATEIVAAPSAMVGSLGVYCLHEDLSAAFEKFGLKLTYISAGKYKVDGNEAEPLSDTARARMQQTVDRYYGLFIKDVAAGRQRSEADIRSGYGQGQCVTADEALSIGMVDRIDTLDNTIAKALDDNAARVATTRAIATRRITARNGFERDLIALGL